MPDIFLSYAHVDDQPFANQEKGWITHFTNHLRNELSRKLGRTDNYSFWKDFRLQGNDAVTSEIEQQVKDAKILVILFSTGWIASPWCQKELKLFQNSHLDLGKRIFVVELERIEMQKKPAIIRDLLSYPFWRQTEKNRVRQLGYPVPQATDKDYFDRLSDLSQELADTLKPLQASASTAPDSPKTPANITPVDDPFNQRPNLTSDSRQFGSKNGKSRSWWTWLVGSPIGLLMIWFVNNDGMEKLTKTWESAQRFCESAAICTPEKEKQTEKDNKNKPETKPKTELASPAMTQTNGQNNRQVVVQGDYYENAPAIQNDNQAITTSFASFEETHDLNIKLVGCKPPGKVELTLYLGDSPIPREFDCTESIVAHYVFRGLSLSAETTRNAAQLAPVS